MGRVSGIFSAVIFLVIVGLSPLDAINIILGCFCVFYFLFLSCFFFFVCPALSCPVYYYYYIKTGIESEYSSMSPFVQFSSFCFVSQLVVAQIGNDEIYLFGWPMFFLMARSKSIITLSLFFYSVQCHPFQ